MKPKGLKKICRLKDLPTQKLITELLKRGFCGNLEWIDFKDRDEDQGKYFIAYTPENSYEFTSIITHLKTNPAR